MKGSTIALIGLGVFNLGLAGLQYAANIHAASRAKVMATEQRTAEVQRAVEEAEKRCDIFKSMSAREQKSFEDGVKDWKVANDFNAVKNDILEKAQEELYEFKVQFGYEQKIEELNDNFNAAVEAFKSSIDYDSTKSSLERTIEEAKSSYEKKKAFLNMADDDTSELAMKLRHSEEELMNATIKDAKTKLEALEKKLKDETEKLTQKKMTDIRVIEENVSREKIRLDRKTDKDLEKLNEELGKAQEDIRKRIRKARTDEEKAAYSCHEGDVRFLREQKVADSCAANDILEAMPKDVKLGRFLAEKKVPKAVVAFVSGIPVGFAAILVKQYVTFVAKVIRAM